MPESQHDDGGPQSALPATDTDTYECNECGDPYPSDGGVSDRPFCSLGCWAAKESRRIWAIVSSDPRFCATCFRQIRTRGGWEPIGPTAGASERRVLEDPPEWASPSLDPSIETVPCSEGDVPERRGVYRASESAPLEWVRERGVSPTKTADRAICPCGATHHGAVWPVLLTRVDEVGGVVDRLADAFHVLEGEGRFNYAVDMNGVRLFVEHRVVTGQCVDASTWRAAVAHGIELASDGGGGGRGCARAPVRADGCAHTPAR